ncbi:MAG: hypothetical protein KKC76_19505 [Proteobacteria bacterium]|nr:hypothetical protein [Pseudomonadota bacterium]MBU4296407.1 hypothetical protein [Pseudomonadota bacterium]MCG2748677.1 hypothetical protein [Desulfobulbaceae bacterium]
MMKSLSLAKTINVIIEIAGDSIKMKYNFQRKKYLSAWDISFPVAVFLNWGEGYLPGMEVFNEVLMSPEGVVCGAIKVSFKWRVENETYQFLFP